MRISTTMLMESYADTLNAKYEAINKYSNQVDSTMAFENASDDPVAAMQTMKLCHEYTLNQAYQSSRSQATEWLNTTESSLNQLGDILKSAQEKVTQAINGTNSDTDLKNFAVAFSSYRDEILTTLNTSYGGQYVYGKGTSDKPPFQIDSASGKLQVYDYKNKAYANVDTVKTANIGAFELPNPVSFGSTSLDISTSALKTIITGTSTDAYDGAFNIVDNITKGINAFNAGDKSGYSSLLTNVQQAQNALLKIKVDVGERGNMLTQIKQRLTDDETNLTAGLANSMEVDSVKAIQNYNISQMVYRQTMSISSTVLQNSLLDFIK